MDRRRGSALTAGILYLQFAFFAAAVLWLWVEHTTFDRFFAALSSIPGAVQLFSVICVLLVVSLLLGLWLTVRRRANRAALIVGGLTVVAAVWWNYFAMAFLVAPVGFAWFSYRATNDG